MKLNLFLLFICLLIIDVKCDYTESELDDIEEDMIIALRKFKKTKQEEDYIREKLCKRNLTIKEWEKLSRYCFDKAMTTKCARCKNMFVNSYEHCNKMVPQTPGCNEITFNKRGACQMEFHEKNRKENLLAYQENKEEFLSTIKRLDDCYKDVVDSNFKLLAS